MRVEGLTASPPAGWGEANSPERATSQIISLSACIYILRLRSGSLYVGWTTNLERRVEEHKRGEGGRTTRNDPPDRLFYGEEAKDIGSAKRREAQLKFSHVPFFSTCY